MAKHEVKEYPYQLSTGNLIFSLLVAGIFVCIGLSMATGNSNAESRAAGWFAVLFCSFLAVLSVVQWVVTRRNKCTLVLSSSKLTVPVGWTYSTNKEIPYKMITKVKVSGVGFIFKPTNELRIYSEAGNVIIRPSFLRLDTDFTEVVSLVQQRADQQ